ncbi:MAG: hypothetical protein IJC53_04895 [Clostridia bacterium]|nr:hypothetical protein [Clostridia bacterium]
MIPFRTDLAPLTEGGYSQAVEAGGMIFVSGQMGRRDANDKPDSGFVPWSAPDQAEQALKNIEIILTEMGSSLSEIVKLTVWFTDMQYLKEIHLRLTAMLGEHRPAMSCAEVRALPRGCKVMIDAVCVRNKD